MKYEYILEKMQGIEELNKKYQTIQSKTGKNNKTFIKSSETRKSKFTKSYTDRLSEKLKKPLFSFYILLFIVLFYISNFLLYQSNKNYYEEHFYTYVYDVFLFSIPIFFIINTVLIGIFSLLIIIYDKFEFLIFKAIYLRKCNFNEIFSTYFYSPTTQADENYIKTILYENSHLPEKLKKFDVIITKNNGISYYEINKIFGLTKKENEMISDLISGVYYTECDNVFYGGLSKKTQSMI